eukprot:CAMPEP_0115845654 /NCGR_PEP_ID=MMETSP0287-20121206/9466_1 /TAXON_ID=412157 /ORGANISM="Chrysochromulina rotalis, Strain UIO044" /LENGTH=104 /DNA_ID=CAMNT_0003299439 /DNA_START=590 /DNA_END=904 /DNA_ORIENTATION=+
MVFFVRPVLATQDLKEVIRAHQVALLQMIPEHGAAGDFQPAKHVCQLAVIRRELSIREMYEALKVEGLVWHQRIYALREMICPCPSSFLLCIQLKFFTVTLSDV